MLKRFRNNINAPLVTSLYNSWRACSFVNIYVRALFNVEYNLCSKIQIEILFIMTQKGKAKLDKKDYTIDKELPYHWYNGARRHILHQTWKEFFVLQLFIMFFKELFTCLLRHKTTINVPFVKSIKWFHGNRNILVTGRNCTFMNFMATSLNPFCSNLLMISAIRPLWTASGLSMRNVRSLLAFFLSSSAILKTYFLATQYSSTQQTTSPSFLKERDRHATWAGPLNKLLSK